MKGILGRAILLLALTGVVVLNSCASAPYTYEAPSSPDSIRRTLGLDQPAYERLLSGATSGSSPVTYPAPEITLSVPPANVQSASPSPLVPPLPGSSGSSRTYPAPAPTTAPSTMPPPAMGETTTRMIVRTGQLSMVVDQVNTAVEAVTQLAGTVGGYVVSASRTGTDNTAAAVMTLRVPAEQFEMVMQTLRDMSVHISIDTTSAEDVSEEFLDLSAKLRNLEAADAQLLEIMKKAEKVEDILAVQREQTSTREEIERTRGRMQYLEQTAAMSLVTVQLQQATMEVQLVAGTRVARAEDTVGFRAVITGGISPFSYLWDFGDGKTSVDAAPFHTYTSSGTYPVSVKVIDDRGNSEENVRDAYIEVMPGWSPGDVAAGAWRAVVSSLRFLYAAVIYLLWFSPVWLIALGIVFYITHRRRKKRARSAIAQDETRSQT